MVHFFDPNIKKGIALKNLTFDLIVRLIFLKTHHQLSDTPEQFTAAHHII